MEKKNHIIDWNKAGLRPKGSDLYPTLCGRNVSIHKAGIDYTESGCMLCIMKYVTPLEIEILPEEITVRTKRDKIEVVHWVEDEWKEDPTIITAIANAIHMAHTEPERLIHINWKHMSSQYEIREKMKDD